MKFVRILSLLLGTALVVQGNDSGCLKSCVGTNISKDNKAGAVRDSCELGCKSLSDLSSKPVDFLKNIGLDADVVKACKHSCEDAFEKAKEFKETRISSCQTACDYKKSDLETIEAAIENVVAERKTLGSVADSKPVEAVEKESQAEAVIPPKEKDPMAPFVNIQIEDIFDDMDSDLGFPRWAQDVQRSMQNMHKQMMSWMPNEIRQKFFGGESINNDMMSKPNPLESFFDSSNFEIVDPKKLFETDEKTKIGGNRVFEIEIIGPYRLDTAQINGIDLTNDALEPPRLPEEGLRTRERTPRWLSIATVSLCIIFILWLCLVIPRNAPKQRVPQIKDVYVVGPSSATAAAKAKEAEAFVSIKMYNSTEAIPTDLPPAYEEIANLQVKLEPAQPIENEETKATKI